MRRTEIAEFVRRHSSAANTVISFYPGFQSFVLRDSDGKIIGIQQYQETRTTWVGASSPVFDRNFPEHAFETLKAFKTAAKKCDKTSLVIPVSKDFLEAAERAGYHNTCIGSEPWHRLNDATHPDQRILNHVEAARRMLKRGAQVIEFEPSKLEALERQAIDELLVRWKLSRKMAPLGFLNRVEPFLLSDQKKYFMLKLDGKIHAFLAGVAISGRRSWFLVDLIRSPHAPSGVTELLSSQILFQLKNEGWEEATFGLSPLARITPRNFRERLLSWCFKSFNLLYDFKNLNRFKEKLYPDYWEPQYLLHEGKSPSFKALLGLSEVVISKGFLTALAPIFGKLFQKQGIEKIALKLISNRYVVRRFPRVRSEWIRRTRISLLILSLVVLMFFETRGSDGQISLEVVQKFGFSWNKFISLSWIEHPLSGLLGAAFLHWNELHLGINLFLLILVMPVLEIIAGSRFILGVFLTGAILANPMTITLFLPVLEFFPKQSAFIFNDVDLGTSLGIFSCLGALSHFLKYRPVWVLISIGVSLIQAWTTDNWLAMNHLVAFGIGWAFALIYLENRHSYD